MGGIVTNVPDDQIREDNNPIEKRYEDRDKTRGQYYPNVGGAQTFNYKKWSDKQYKGPSWTNIKKSQGVTVKRKRNKKKRRVNWPDAPKNGKLFSRADNDHGKLPEKEHLWARKAGDGEEEIAEPQYRGV